MEWKTLPQKKNEAEQETKKLGHTFATWEDRNSSYRREKDSSHAHCLYCSAEIWVHSHSIPEGMSGSALTQECLSVGRTVDPEGLAVTTWDFCRKCDKKLNLKNKNEVLKGFHTRCQNRYDGTIILDMHNGLIQLRMKTA
jgi:hypothetical protein